MTKFSFIFLFLLCLSCSDSSKNIKSQKLPYLSEEIIEFDGYYNQDSVAVNNKTYKNKIWISEFFFATCPTICPIMNSQMKQLQKEIKDLGFDSKVQFLSFTIDPIKDTPSALKKHKSQLCNNCKNWDFLTGDEEFTHRLGIERFKVFAGRDEEAAGGYAHSGAFSLVDQSGFLRGVYNITGFDGSVDKKEYHRLKSELLILVRSKK